MTDDLDVATLESRIEELERENERLMDEIADLEENIDDLEENPKYEIILTQTVDRLAEIGLIDSYPAAKRMFIEGERSI